MPSEHWEEAVRKVFAYPTEPHSWKHGPVGYRDYRSYKAWLRDEFQYQCIYCLCRERWEPNGQATFSVDHLLPQSTHPGGITDYERMVYCCLTCNSIRQDSWLPIDPNTDAFGLHLETNEIGLVTEKSEAGLQLIKTFQLNRPSLAEYRQEVLKVLTGLALSKSSNAKGRLRHLLGYPSDLPDLSRKHPSDNLRKEGLQLSAFELRARGKLPEWY